MYVRVSNSSLAFSEEYNSGLCWVQPTIPSARASSTEWRESSGRMKTDLKSYPLRMVPAKHIRGGQTLCPDFRLQLLRDPHFECPSFKQHYLSSSVTELSRAGYLDLEGQIQIVSYWGWSLQAYRTGSGTSSRVAWTELAGEWLPSDIATQSNTSPSKSHTKASLRDKHINFQLFVIL